MKELKNYCLLLLIILSAALFSVVGLYWNIRYYDGANSYSPLTPPLATAMQGLHDKLYFADYSGYDTSYGIQNLDVLAASVVSEESAQQFGLATEIMTAPDEQNSPLVKKLHTYEFTSATDDYFDGACFIGDSRTVGMNAYSGIENAVFLCKTSLSIYDYEQPKITYEGRKKSIRDVLSERQFTKIYLMLGINECGYGTAQSFFESYRAVVEDIRRLQPEALIFIQGNLFVTQKKSDEGKGITNERLAERNALLATLANQRDIFYIDINESALCKDGALNPEYTWDQVHMKAQYYPIWKDFLLSRAIKTE